MNQGKKTDEPGVPEKLLKEFIRKKITVDTSSGEVYVGTLVDAEENMNMSLTNVTTTFPSGHTAEMISVYIKGAKVRYIGLPPEAKEIVSELARKQQQRSFGRGRGRGGRGGRGGGGRGFDRRRY